VYFTASTATTDSVKCDYPKLTGKISGNKNDFYVKVLPDTGAYIAFITEKVALQLAQQGHGLIKEKIETSFEGVNNTTLKNSNSSISFTLHSISNYNIKYTLNAYIVQRI
jgi:hypothetical protein